MNIEKSSTDAAWNELRALCDHSEKNPVYNKRFKLYGHDYYAKEHKGLGGFRQSFDTLKEALLYCEDAEEKFMCRGFDFWSIWDSKEQKLAASRFGLNYNYDGSFPFERRIL